MFMRELLMGGVLIMACGAAQAQTADTRADEGKAETAMRTTAAPPETIGDAEEPMPPSPVVDEPADPEAVPEIDGNFGIGHPATEAEIARIDIDVMPDGTGLPEGRGTYAQGQELYAEKCLACHGENLEGVAELGAPALIGGRDSLATDKPVKTVESYWPHASTLFDYVHRAMPLDSPGSLSADETYAIAAFILGKGGILDEDSELDSESFRKIVIPNEQGFTSDPRPKGF